MDDPDDAEGRNAAIDSRARFTPEETLILTRTRDERLRLEAIEFAFDMSVRRLHAKRRLLDILSLAVVVGFLYAQFVAGRGTMMEQVIGVVGTGCSVALVVLVAKSWLDNWSGQIEKKGEISRRLHEVIVAYNDARTDPEKLGECAHAAFAIHNDRKHDLATVERRCYQLGWQHVAKKYPEAELQCTDCRQKWDPLRARRARWKPSFLRCSSCGV